MLNCHVHSAAITKLSRDSDTEIDSLDDAGWNVDILHWDDFPKLPQTIHIFDLTAELGAREAEIIGFSQ